MQQAGIWTQSSLANFLPFGLKEGRIQTGGELYLAILKRRRNDKKIPSNLRHPWEKMFNKVQGMRHKVLIETWKLEVA